MYFDQHTIEKYRLTQEQLNLTLSSYAPLNLQSNEWFLKDGQVCNRIGFVKNGLLRSYFFDDQGDEITTAFYPEGSLIIAFESFNNRLPSKESIKAVENSELMIIGYDRQKELYQLIPAWNHICKDLADVMSREMIERTKSFQVLSAAERYKKFCEDHPVLLQRVNLGYIASYLGVDIATLSRIRAKR